MWSSQSKEARPKFEEMSCYFYVTDKGMTVRRAFWMF